MTPSIRSAVLVAAMIPIVTAAPSAVEPQPLTRHQPTFEQFTSPAYPVETAWNTLAFGSGVLMIERTLRARKRHDQKKSTSGPSGSSA